MKIEIYSKAQPNLLLHVILRAEDFADDRRENVGDPNDALQVAMIGAVPGMSYRAHKHLAKAAIAHVTQESWVVVAGEVEATYYDVDSVELQSAVLRVGDCSITRLGGHSYKILLGTSARVYEFKSGPYYGQLEDKEFIR